MDLTFVEAMAQVESFHPRWELAVFEGATLRGVLRLSAPDVCVHGDQFEIGQPNVNIVEGGVATASYPCGCVYIGRFRRASRV